MASHSSTVLRWKWSHYLDLEEKGILVKCRLCASEKLLSTAKNTTSNLKKHLHAKNNRVGRERCVPSQAKQQKLDFSSPSPGETITSPELNKLVAAFIVEEMQPLWSRLHFAISSNISDRQNNGGACCPIAKPLQTFWTMHIWRKT